MTAAGEAPLVSVVIPAHNAADTIQRALASALGQTGVVAEVIVVDDASTDRTHALAAAADPGRVRVIKLSANGGAAYARNQGLAAARGRFIAFLDADDEWLPGKLRAQADAMLANPDWVLCGANTRWVFPDGRPARVSEPPPTGALGDRAWRWLLANCFINTTVVMARTDVIRALGGFDTSQPAGEDQDMWIRLALTGAVGHVDVLAARVHATPGSLTRSAPRCDATYLIPMVKRHLAAQRDRLDPAEIDQILGARYSTIGRNLYRHGDLLAGAVMLARAIRRRHRVTENALYLLVASPPAQWLKRLAPVRRWRTRTA
jgi:glycosyltransferase involved in cell wall biosynthesis